MSSVVMMEIEDAVQKYCDPKNKLEKTEVIYKTIPTIYGKISFQSTFLFTGTVMAFLRVVFCVALNTIVSNIVSSLGF